MTLFSVRYSCNYFKSYVKALRLMYNAFFKNCIIIIIIFLKVKGMKTAQMFFEDCVGTSKSAI